MIEIPLLALPNQEISIRLDNSIYDITLKAINDSLMAATIVRDAETLVEGGRCVAGTPLLPYKYLEKGNFMFITEDNDYPYYTQFNVTQSLIYLSPAEIDA